MKVELLDDVTKKEAVISSWENHCSDPGDLFAVREDLLSNSHDWYLVQGGDELGTKLAVFDVRKVPEHYPMQHKTVRIHFSPTVNLDMVNQDLATAEEEISKVLSILEHAFKKMLECSESTADKICRIFCEHKLVSVILLYFAKFLEDNYPGQYKVKFYNKWIEIKTIEGGIK